ncbi:bestrophin-like domain [Solidesulfovibrio sp.]
MTGNIFIISEVTVVAILGIPTAIYLFFVYRSKAKPVEQLSETIANFGLFNSLYSVFLSMALVTLMVNFYTVQDDTSNEAEAIVSAMRLANGLSDATSLKLSLVAYAKSVVDYDLKAMQTGQMSAEASTAFDHLWDKAYNIKLATKNDESIHRALIADWSCPR